MFGSVILDVAIGVVLVYLLLSLACSSLNEFISGIFSFRSKNLEMGIANLLSESGNSNLADKIYSHPLIKGFTKPGKKPSYIPSRTFTLVLLDILTPAGTDIANIKKDDLINTINKVDSNLITDDFKKALLTLINDAGDDIKKARENLENWFDDSMDRVSGWYKRKSQNIILGFAVLITFSLNVDTFEIVNSLRNDNTLRASIVAVAGETVSSNEKSEPGSGSIETTKAAQKIKAINQELDSLNLPIGWKDMKKGGWNLPIGCSEWIMKIIGLLITTFAVSLGAPFWFDILKKIISIRSTGIQPKRASESK